MRSPFVGRERELGLLQDTWATARRREAQVAGIEGEAGIGKSALLRRFADIAARSADVVWVSGDEQETALAWGVLGQIMRLLDFHDPSADPVFAGQALARRLQDGRETVLIVDDAHWADRPSMAAVRLAARRLLADPVMVVVASQGEIDDGWRRLLDSERGVRIALSGLTADDLIRLSAACGHPGLTPAGAARLHEHTGGHPLHARHLLAELPPHALSYGQGPLPAPRSLATTVAARIEACHPATRELVAAGAVIGRRFSLSAAKELAEEPADIGEAVTAGLIEEVPGAAGQELAFTSSLIRGVVYHGVSRARRRELHRRQAARGGRGSVWHRVAAADGPDEELAADIERAARDQLTRGGPHPAAADLRHALDLTPYGPARPPRLLAAVEALLVTGDIATTLAYQDELAALGQSAWADYVSGYQLLLLGQFADARSRLLRSLGQVRAGDRDGPPDLEARVTSQLAIISILSVSYEEMIEYGAAAVAGAAEPWVAACASFTRALGLAIAGKGAEALAEMGNADTPGAPGGLDGLVARGMVRLWADDLAGARDDLTTAVRRATKGEPLRIAQVLGFLGEAEYRAGALGEAVLHTELAIGDAEENNRVWDYAMLRAMACYPRAARGEWEAAEEHAAESSRWARAVGSPAGLVYSVAARAAIAQARDDAALLLAIVRPAEPAGEHPMGFYPGREPGTHLLGPLLADALSRLGRPAEAQQALDAFPAISTIRRSTQAIIARVRAQIAAAREAYETALEACGEAERLAGEAGLRLEAARAVLLAGTVQAAAGRRAAAERSLRTAMRRFGIMGATAYVTLTLAAAERAGLPLDGTPAALATLTPAERAVTSLVHRGMSNRQIAERLVLSVKTVEFHLTNVFRRLDVGTRAELRDALTQGGPGDSLGSDPEA
ncbi:AAA family ATPase [Streptosporangiaceae bacterium NEAU-GS5]|nr:AAA family ATPase [Streptosporangiaceae bacterium NEAU-GS5]